jgi:hypothetical protein
MAEISDAEADCREGELRKLYFVAFRTATIFAVAHSKIIQMGGRDLRDINFYAVA